MKAWFKDFHPLILLFIGLVIGMSCMGLIYFKYGQVKPIKPDVISHWYKTEELKDHDSNVVMRIEWLSDTNSCEYTILYPDEVPEFLKSLGVE